MCLVVRGVVFGGFYISRGPDFRVTRSLKFREISQIVFFWFVVSIVSVNSFFLVETEVQDFGGIVISTR